MTIKVLFVCRGNRRRSPSAESMFNQIAVEKGYRVYGKNCFEDCDFYTMSAGILEEAVIPMTKQFWEYFDRIIALDDSIKIGLERAYGTSKKIESFQIPDFWPRYDPELMGILRPKIEKLLEDIVR